MHSCAVRCRPTLWNQAVLALACKASAPLSGCMAARCSLRDWGFVTPALRCCGRHGVWKASRAVWPTAVERDQKRRWAGPRDQTSNIDFTSKPIELADLQVRWRCCGATNTSASPIVNRPSPTASDALA